MEVKENRYSYQEHGNKRGTHIQLVGFDGEKLTLFIPDEKMLKLTRMVKLLGLQEDTDFLTFEERIKVNELRFRSLSDRIDKHIKLNKKPYVLYSDSWYWNRRKPSRKSLRTIKRQKLAKENRSCNKSKDKG